MGDKAGFADFEQAIAIATEARSPNQLQNALNNLLTRQVSLGRLEEAAETLVACRRNLDRHPTSGRRRWVGLAELELAVLTGNWTQAKRLADAFLAESHAATRHVLDPIVHLLRALILLAQGDLATASADTEAALALASREEVQRGMEAGRAGKLLLELGRRDKAAALFAELLGLREHLVYSLNDSPITDAAWLAHDLGRPDDYAALVVGSPQIPWAVAAEAICVGEFPRAADVLEAIGYRPGEAYARLRAAKQLVQEGRRAEADAELQQALAFWREVGAKRYVREGEALLAASA
jgi:tetratricopeptide (TPR) repeat protein